LGEEKNHKALPASAVAAAAANFHTLNIYFESLLSLSLSPSPSQTLNLHSLYFLLLITTGDRRFGSFVSYDNSWGVNFKLFSSSGIVTSLQGGTVAKCCLYK
jgi:hypothetical protein